ETEDRDVRVMPGMPAVDPRAAHMRRVQNELQPMFTAEVPDRLILPAVAAEADEHHGSGPEGNPVAHALRIEAEILVDIGKDGLQAGIEDGVVGGDEGQRRRDDLVFLLPSEAAAEN